MLTGTRTRSQIIDGLRCVLTTKKPCGGCEKCPYFDDGNEYDGCNKQAVQIDALVFLESNNAHVMELSEVFQAEKDGEEMWVERRQERCGGWAKGNRIPGGQFRFKFTVGIRELLVIFDIDDYGIGWRCWTAKPEIEMMESEPWDDGR